MKFSSTFFTFCVILLAQLQTAVTTSELRRRHQRASKKKTGCVNKCVESSPPKKCLEKCRSKPNPRRRKQCRNQCHRKKRIHCKKQECNNDNDNNKRLPKNARVPSPNAAAAHPEMAPLVSSTNTATTQVAITEQIALSAFDNTYGGSCAYNSTVQMQKCTPAKGGKPMWIFSWYDGIVGGLYFDFVGEYGCNVFMTADGVPQEANCGRLCPPKAANQLVTVDYGEGCQTLLFEEA